MVRSWVVVMMLVGVLGPGRATGQEPAATQPRSVLHLPLAAAIDPVASLRIREAIDEAGRRGNAAVVVEMDTPGGLLTSTREIVQAIFASPVPVIVYVGPSGARAGSAGVFLTLASHVAAMAPGTNIGAAHPVAISSPGGGGGMGETMEAKVTNDAAAFARSIAERRGRNATWAEGAVRESLSATENEALKEGVIDLIAADLPALLDACDGRTVDLPSGPTVLHTKGATVIPQAVPFKYRFLGWLANPNTAYLLMLLGVYGLIFELSNPGAIFPGVAGAISLVLAAFALGMLPFNAAGIALIVLAIALFIIDLFVPTHGILTTGGVVAFTIGSIMLFDVPEAMNFGISWQVLIPATAATAAFFIFAVGLGLKAQRRHAITGQGGLVGEVGRARTELTPAGKVFLHGEIWNARAAAHIAVGEPVRVVAVRGMELDVEPVAPERSGPHDS
ncbi:MAG: nodulation protein NfeD [Nitrospirota bacterium]